MQTMVMLGAPPEKYWPYKIANFDTEPSAFLYSLAENYKGTKYYRLVPSSGQTQLDALLTTLAAGLPFMFGFTVYSSISNDALIPFPKQGDQVEGGHAIMAVGYDDAKKALLIRNSWGISWGDKGYGWLPYDYVSRGLADDFWSLVSADFIDTDLFK
jgi:C1A family cysteine protease